MQKRYILFRLLFVKRLTPANATAAVPSLQVG
jgi:hypothetical protein